MLCKYKPSSVSQRARQRFLERLSIRLWLSAHCTQSVTAPLFISQMVTHTEVLTPSWIIACKAEPSCQPARNLPSQGLVVHACLATCCPWWPSAHKSARIICTKFSCPARGSLQVNSVQATHKQVNTAAAKGNSSRISARFSGYR